MFPSSIILDLLTAAGLFAGLVACLELWFYLGHRAFDTQTEHPDQLATIQGALLGWLALLAASVLRWRQAVSPTGWD